MSNLVKICILSLLSVACSEADSGFSETDKNRNSDAKQQEVVEELTVSSPVMVGGAFLACMAESQDADEQNVQCTIQSETPFPWDMMTVRVGEKDGDIQKVDFEEIDNGIQFKWSPDQGYYVLMSYLTQIWETEIQMPLLQYSAVVCDYENDEGCFFLGDVGQSCTEVCEDRQGVDFEGLAFMAGSFLACNEVLTGLDAETYARRHRVANLNTPGVILGTVCGVENDENNGAGNASGWWYVEGDTIDAGASEPSLARPCSCKNGRP